MKKIILITILAIFTLAFFSFVESSSADIVTIFVDDDYDETTQGWNVDHFSSILDAINAAKTEDTVFVYNGTYFGHIILDKSIVLVGEDKNNTIIDGEGFGNTVSVVADNVSISEFMIRNSGVESNNSGLMVLSDDNIIYDNIIVNNSVGIILQRCKNNIVKDNFVESNVFGIGLHHCNEENSIFKNYVYDSNVSGIYLAYCANNTVNNNTIRNNSYGIALSFGEDNTVSDNFLSSNRNDGLNLYFCNETVFVRNKISGSEYGIASAASNNNLMNENYIYNNSLYGIKLVLGSCNNEVYDNIITDGDVGVYISMDSFDTHLNGNLFSDNSQKLVDKTIVVDDYSSPGFELVIVIIAFVVVILKRRLYL